MKAIALRPAPSLRAGLLGVLLASCNPAGADDGFDFSTESVGPVPSTTGTGGSSGTETDTAADTTGGTAADTGSGSEEGSESSTTDAPPSEPCTAVDILFVVDNSEPMLEEQMRLRAAANNFVTMVQGAILTLTSDINIGVVTTDDELLVTANEVPCMYEGANNWMVSSSLTLATELECALTLGVAGSPNERPMDMLLGSLSDENLAPGGPHNGFLREEALLVVVLVTNEEDEFEKDTSWGSAGDPPEWVASLADRKGGHTNNVVVLSLLGIEPPNACDLPWNGTDGAQSAPRLAEFTESFPQGAVGDICEQEYATFLLGVVPGVAGACANFIPY